MRNPGKLAKVDINYVYINSITQRKVNLESHIKVYKFCKCEQKPLADSLTNENHYHKQNNSGEPQRNDKIS